MNIFKGALARAIAVVGLLGLAACNGDIQTSEGLQPAAPAAVAADFDKDRAAILAMAGDYKVSFDFQETVSFMPGYEKKDRYVTGAHEMVRVIKDTGDFISMQHILVVGGQGKMPEMAIKHWRQDWIYEPTEIMDFVGANTWQKRQVATTESTGKWAQIVYQVDDTPRYAGIAAWDHSNGTSEWTSPPSLRPLPRRDATKRDDYHAIEAINRHALTPNGWVHEQENSKLILTGDTPRLLVREIGINTYDHFDGFKTEIGTDYWTATKDFWAAIRAEWNQIVDNNDQVALTVLGEPEAVYMPILGIASDVADGKVDAQQGAEEALEFLREHVTTTPEAVVARLRRAAAESTSADSYSR